MPGNVLPKIFAVAAVLTSSSGVCGGATDQSGLCGNIIDKSITTPEHQVSMVIGRALFYGGHPRLGVAPTTACLLSIFGGTGNDIGWPREWVSSALLDLMIVDPSDWFDSATKADKSIMRAWFHKPLLASQLWPIGRCPTPDKFAVAVRVLEDLRFSEPARESLRVELVQRLSALHCEEPQ